MFSLEKFCLDSIVQNFERFYLVFTVSKENSPHRRNLEFLQRKYSDELAAALYEGKYLKAEYLTLLINEHLKILDGNWLSYGLCFESIEDIFIRLPNLTGAHFRSSNGNDEILKNVADFCPKIIEIDVTDSKVTDDGVKYLCEIKNGVVSCPKIKNIFINLSRVTGIGVEALIRNLPLLEKIDHPNVPLVLHSIYNEGLSDLRKVYYFHLVELHFFETWHEPFYLEILKACLTVCPKLESIICRLTNEEQLEFFNNINLKKAYLSFPRGNLNIDNFLKVNGRNLTYLQVGQCSLSVSELGKNCPLLKELTFKDQVHFTDKDDEHVQVLFPSLIECSFNTRDPPSERAFTLLLSSSPKLKSLSFSNTSILSLRMKHQILLRCKNDQISKHEA